MSLVILATVLAFVAVISLLFLLRHAGSKSNLSSFRDSALPAIGRNVETFFAQAAIQGNSDEVMSQFIQAEFATTETRTGIPTLFMSDYLSLMDLVRVYALFLVSERQTE